MKKSLSVILLLCMLIGMFGGVSAFATEGEETAEVVEVEETVGEEAAEDVVEEPAAEPAPIEEIPAEEAEITEVTAESTEESAEETAEELAPEDESQLAVAEFAGAFSEDGEGIVPTITLGTSVEGSDFTGKFTYPDATVTGTVKQMTITVDSGSFAAGSGYAVYKQDMNGLSKTYQVTDAIQAQALLRSCTFTISGSTKQNITVSVSGNTTDLSALPTYANITITQHNINGVAHYYGFVQLSTQNDYNVTNSIAFSDAYAQAKKLTYNGLKGYLATITSSEENTVLDNLTKFKGWGGAGRVTQSNAGLNGDTFTNGGSIIGASSGSTWYWVCGPEAGQQLSYTYWANGEPNGGTGTDGEYLLMLHHENAYKWNDIRNGAHKLPGYFVEWSEDTRTSGSLYAEATSVNQKHTHGSWSYTVSGGTLTAHCNAVAGTCSLSGKTVSVTLSASTPATYTGSAYTGASLSNTSAWTAAGLTTPTIHYVGRGSTTYEDSTTAPTDAGTYTAQITADSVTAKVDFEITKKQLSVSGSSATKVYDGNTTATITVGTVSGKCGTDDVTVTASGSYSSADVGSTYTIAATYTLSGAKANNYIAPVAENITNASITKKQLTVSVPTVADKVYDGTDTATATVGTVDGKISGDDVAVEVDSATFAGALAASEKDVTVSYKLSGTKANNYIAPDEDTVKAAITPKSIQLTANSKSKTYDGRALSDGGYTITDGEPAAGDTLTVTVKGEITEVGSADNKIVSYTIKNADQTDVTACYSVQTVSGKLVVKPDEKADVRVDSEKLNEVVEKFKEKYKEDVDYDPDDILSVILKTDGDIPQKDKQMIREKAGDKQVVYANAELWLAVNGELKKNIGDENETLIDVVYSFDFAGKESVQVFRVHNDKVDELTEEPNDAGEYVSFDKANKTVTVTAMKYSTYAITYTVPQAKAQAPTTGDNNALGLWIGIASMSVIAMGVVLTAKKRRS